MNTNGAKISLAFLTICTVEFLCLTSEYMYVLCLNTLDEHSCNKVDRDSLREIFFLHRRKTLQVCAGQINT